MGVPHFMLSCQAMGYSLTEPRNVRECAVCKQAKHLRMFDLVAPDDPANSNRYWACRPCFAKEVKKGRKSPAYLARRAEYRQQSKNRYKAMMASFRQTLQTKATPRWVDTDRIAELYAECQVLSLTTGVKHNVDHIVPLVHPRVCGLHVPQNLRILTATENSKKNNHFDMDHVTALMQHQWAGERV